jgi:hypothetical protein
MFSFDCPAYAGHIIHVEKPYRLPCTLLAFSRCISFEICEACEGLLIAPHDQPFPDPSSSRSEVQGKNVRQPHRTGPREPRLAMNFPQCVSLG